MLTQQELMIATLGPCGRPSPLRGDKNVTFVNDAQHIRYQHRVGTGISHEESELSFEEAGPRRDVFFDPANTSGNGMLILSG